jgi:hypothetical protein
MSKLCYYSFAYQRQKTRVLWYVRMFILLEYNHSLYERQMSHVNKLHDKILNV